MSSFYKPTKYNGSTKQQMWMSMIADGHDMHCDCPGPFAHLLDCIFPEGHKDRNLTIEQIITRDKQQCHSGGTEEESHGLVAGDTAATIATKEKDIQGEDDDLDMLLAAAAVVDEDTR